eukprot:12370954-Ditylum_brightwellii.AAC.1
MTKLRTGPSSAHNIRRGMMIAVEILSRWKKEGVTPSTPSVTICESTSSASKTTMSSESADLANCSHSQ